MTAAQLKLHRVTNGTWQEMIGSVVDVATNTVTTPLSSLSSYALLRERVATQISASPDPIILNALAATAPITVVLRDANGRVLDTRAVAFNSANPAVAIVSPQGVVTATGAGTTTVTVSLGSLTATVVVRVTQIAQTVTVTPPATNLNAIGATQQLTAAVYDVNSVLIANAPVTWSTTDPNVATVSSTGLVTSTGNGTATITATSGAASTGVPVNVQQVATTLAVHAGNGQLATVQTAVAVQPAVIARDANSFPVPGVSVTFAVTGGGGALTGANATTGTNGVAQLGSWTLGAVAGPNALTATAGALTAGFSATATAGAPASIVKIAGDGQSVTVGTPVPAAPAVRVQDALGNPVPNVTVTFSVQPGNGTITGATATTNAAGDAAVGSWVVSQTAGNNQMLASVTGLSAATFNATGTAGAPALLSKVAGDGGTMVVAGTRTLQVRVVDGFGNPVATQSVGWAVVSGGGSVSAASSQTDAAGLASIDWTAGTMAGAQSATATVGTITGSPATFAFTATPGAASAANSSIAALPASITADGTSTSTLTVRARDQFNNDVQSGGAAVVLTRTGPGTLSIVSDAGNGQYNATLVAPTTTGSATITATLNGGAVPGSAAVSFVAGPLNNFLVEAQGGGAIGAQLVGASFNIRVTARDAFNNTVTAFTGTTNITSTGTLASGSGTTAAFTAGVLASHAVSFSAPGSVTITATNSAGAASGTSSSFMVEGVPVVTGTLPLNNAIGVVSNTNVSVTFSEPVNVAGNWFTMVCATSGVRTPANAAVSGGPTSFTIDPNSDFAPGETCAVTVHAAQVSDQDTNDPPDNPAVDHLFNFTIDAAPVVTGTTPANAALVASNAALTVNFSEAVNATTSSFTLVCPVGTPRTFTLSASPASSFTLTPSAPLPAGACRLTVLAAQITDVDASDPPDNMAANLVVDFTVDAAPAVLSTLPAATGVIADNGTITVNFSEAVHATTSSFVLECPVGTPRTFTLSASPASTFILTPTAPLPAASCRLTVVANQVSDVDAVDPPDNLPANHVVDFTVDAAPAVLATSPLSAALAANNTAISVTFSEAVNATTSSFALECPVGTPRTFTLSASPATTFTLTPNAPLPAGACRVTVIANQITDADTNDPPDNLAANHVLDFTVDAPPAVTGTSPLNAAVVANSSAITINFSEAVNATTSSFTLECPAGTPVAYTLSASPSSSFTLTPNAPLPAGACRVTVLAGQITDVDASDPPDNPAANHVLDFTVDAAPAVTGTVPLAAASVADNGVLTVNFSEPVNATTSSFTIECPVGSARPYTLSASPSSTFTLTPNSALPAGSCRLTVIANQISDVDGFDPPDGLAANHVVNFTVDAAPTVTGTSPIAAAIVANNSAITVNFSEQVNASTSSFTIECPVGTARTFTLSASPATSFTLTPTAALPAGGCRLTVIASQVTDTDATDPPDNMVANHVVDFSVDAPPSAVLSPVNGATGITTNANLTVTFDEPVVQTGNWFQIVCTASGTRNVADTNVTGGPTSFTINPNVDFTQAETCTITVFAAQIADQDATDPPNNMTANVVGSFTIDAAPSVTASTPSNGGVLTNPASDLSLTFSEAVNVTGNWFQLVCSVSGTRTPADAVITGGPASFTINPNADFQAHDNCTLTVFAAQISDQDGNDPPDNMTANHVLSFVVEQAPAVVSNSPLNNAIDIPSNTNLTVTFSEPVNVTGNWFQIICASSGIRNVAATAVSGGPTTFTINPNVDFTQSETCTVTLFAAQITDQDANDPPGFDNPSADHLFAFTMDAAPSATITPANTATGVNTSANLTVAFSEPVNVLASWFQLICTVSGTRNVSDASVTGGPGTFSINPNTDFTPGESCTMTVFATQITDIDGNDPPDNMLANATSTFTIDAAPSVTATTPVNGAAVANFATDLTVTFSEPVNVTGNWFQIACTVSGLRTPADAAVSGGPTTFTINPNANFQSGDSCTVTVFGSQVSDQDGNDPPDNMAANHVFSFVLEEPPTVTATTPTSAATGISSAANVSLTFSEAVNVTGNWFQIACTVSGTRNVAATAVSGGPSTFTINPNADFAAGEDCTVTVFGAQVTDQDANDPPDAMAANHVFTFTVDQAPSVTATTPADNALSVALNANVTITFSEPVNVAGNWFTIVCPTSGTRNVAATAVSGGPTTYTIDPNVDFAAGENCTVSLVAAQVTDVDANDPPDAMAAGYAFAFTTESPPSVTSSAPLQGGLIGTTSNVTLTFNEPVTVSGNWFSIVCSVTGTRNPADTNVSGGPALFTINPTTDFAPGESCAFTVFGAQVSDQDAIDPPDAMGGNHIFTFNIDAPPAVASTSPVDNANTVLPTATITVNFNEQVNATLASFTLECPVGSARTFTLSASPAASFTLTPTAQLPAGTTCRVTVNAAQISDTDAQDPPDLMAADYVFSFSIPLVATNDTYPQTVIGNMPINSANIPYSVVTNDQSGSSITISAFDATSVAGGTVSMTTSGVNIGQFTYNPPAGYEGNDSFTYTLSNGTTTSVGTVSLTVSGMVWFIDAAAGAGDGRFNTPFNSITAFNAVNNGAGNNPAPGDRIFVLENAAPYAGALTLLNNQRLIGQDARTSLAALHGTTPPSGSAAFPAMNLGGNATTLSGGITLANGASASIYGLTLSPTSGQAISSGANFGTLSFANGTTEPADVTISTVGAGALSLTTGALSGQLSGVSVSGAPAISLSTVTGTLTILSGDMTGSTGTAITVAGGSVSLTSNATVTQSGGTNAVLINGAHAGTLDFNALITASGGTTGINANNADGTYQFDGGISVTSGVSAGVAITTGSGGTFTFATNSSITNPSGDAFLVDASAPTVTYSGTISKNAGGRVAAVTNLTGGNVTFGGNLSATSGTGILVQNNTGGAVTFSGASKSLSTGTNPAVTISSAGPQPVSFTTGGLVITTTSGTGFGATSGANGSNIAVTGTGNTITTGTGVALSLTGATITSSNLTFQSISVNGAPNGIVLNNTGSSGSLVVTGSGGVCTLATTTCTGGLIQNTSSHGISLSSTLNPNLSLMRVLNTAGNGINGTGVNGMTLNNTIIVGAGDADNEAALLFTSGSSNLTGTVSMTGVAVDAPADLGMFVQNTAAPTLLLTITGSTFQNTILGTPGVVTGDDLLRLVADAGATITARVTTSTFQNSEGDGIAAMAQGGIAAGTGGTVNLTVTNSALVGGAAPGNTSDNGLVAWGIAGGVVRFNFSSNSSIRNWRNETILVRADNNANVQGTIDSNTIGQAGTSRSGSFSSYGVSLATDDNAQMVATVQNNTFRSTFWSGIAAVIGNGGGAATQRLDANILNNSLPDVVVETTVFLENIMYLHGNVGTGCARVTGNTANIGAQGAGAIGLVGNGNGAFILHGLGGGTDAAATTRLQADNPGTAPAQIYAFNAPRSPNWQAGSCGTPLSTPIP